VAEAVHVAGTENKGCAELERIFAEFVLAMAGGVGAVTGDSVVATQQVKQVSSFQFGSVVGGAVRVNQKRKRDAGLFAEQASVAEIAHADRREIRSTLFDFGLMLAQLRDVLAAKYSAVMPQKNDDRWLRLPQRAEAHGTLVGIGKNDCGQLRAETFCGHLLAPYRQPSLTHDWAKRSVRPLWPSARRRCRDMFAGEDER
jgi:hypothetical protein